MTFFLEMIKVFENLRHGIIFGTKRYLNKITAKHLKKESDAELPQLNRIIKDKDPAKLLKSAAKVINFNLTKLSQSDRIPKKDIQDRDVLLYFLRGTGLYTNKQIGEIFGLTYSAVSRRANIVKSEIFKQSEMRQKYSMIKSMIKKDRRLLFQSGWIENVELGNGFSFRLRSSNLGLRPAGCDPTRRRDKAAILIWQPIVWRKNGSTG